jgi:3-ketosteroid 9alpha-monooxygenase subunit A
MVGVATVNQCLLLQILRNDLAGHSRHSPEPAAAPLILPNLNGEFTMAKKQLKITKHWRHYAVTGDAEPERPYINGQAPLPYPESWFMVAASAEVPRNKVVTRRLMGEDVVIYRTNSGRPRAVTSQCPHLGAHLGNGWVDGETIMCAFHQFSFGHDGQVAKLGLGYTGKPKHCRLPILRCTEANGGIFVWVGSAAPAWEIPTLLTDRHTPPIYRAYELPTHPQEVMENTVDCGHLRTMHGYADTTIPREPVIDKHTYSHTLHLVRPFPPFGKLAINIDLVLYGLGLFHAVLSVREIGLEQCVLVAARPIEPWRIHFIVGGSVLLAPTHGPLSRIPAPLLYGFSRIVSPIYHRLALSDFNRDFQIWASKRYVEPSRLTIGDGPIGSFRKWARQFYPKEPVTPTRSTVPVDS